MYSSNDLTSQSMVNAFFMKEKKIGENNKIRYENKTKQKTSLVSTNGTRNLFCRRLKARGLVVAATTAGRILLQATIRYTRFHLFQYFVHKFCRLPGYFHFCKTKII